MKTGAEIITEERIKQISKWPASHDDDHDCEEIIFAAMAYLDFAAGSSKLSARMGWPFEPESFTPNRADIIHTLAIAGAFIAAEIDRINRLKGATDERA